MDMAAAMASVEVDTTARTSPAIARPSTHKMASESVEDAATRDAQERAKAALPVERLHSTVHLNQFTLRFEDEALENAYRAYSHRRKKALWLRSLVPAAAFHILFGLGDCLEHPPDHLLVTIPARVLLSVLQISMFILVRWDLVPASESTMLVVSICNGIPTLLLYALQRTSLHQWDALFVVFGLSFYTIPKITPLGFVASLVGSWFTAILYAALSFLVRPPTRPFESLLGFLYCAPVIGIFNTISYYSEYNSRERFVLRRRLRSESITLAVSRTKTLPVVHVPDGSNGFLMSNKFAVGVVLWGAFTLGGWTSLPDMLKFVDEDTGWAWFSHCAGMTMFLLVMTRQLQWLFVVPVLGAILLWMMTLAMPASWIIISAHSMGYGLLLASIIIAMGVFSRFVFVWRELVSFLTRSCFLYPQLQAGLQDEFPLLVKIVSEYTAGMDPEIISSRDSNIRAITNHPAGVPLSPVSKPVGFHHNHQSHHNFNSQGGSMSMNASRSSPRRRMLMASASAVAASSKTLPALNSPTLKASSSHNKSHGHASEARLLLVEPRGYEDDLMEERDEFACNKMVSMLPSFKPGKCFFCSKNEAEHFVPACGMWGKWTHWRMSQQQDILYGSLALPGASGSSSTGGGVVGKPAASMCTSYYDVQQQKSELEQRVAALEQENKQLRADLETKTQEAKSAVADKVLLQGEIRALEEKRTTDLLRQEATLQKKVDQVLAESNHVAHHHKLQLRELEAQAKKLTKELQEARAMGDAMKDQRQRAVREARELQEKENLELREEVARIREELETLRASTRPNVATSSDQHQSLTTEDAAACVSTITTLQPSRRLPYARWIEIEGLRESIRKKDEGTPTSDLLQPWSTGF